MAGRGVDIILGGNPPDSDDAKNITELGGLHVMGTERHDARRIDNQLRGRAGRQGDIGSSQFFVSLEDDLMRIFGGDKIKNLMTALNVPEDEPIQANIISGAIESAQSKIEGFNFDARKHLLEYDDVVNRHREIIYKKRRKFLEEPSSAEASTGKQDLVKKYVSLQVIDHFWQGHLSDMDHLRDSVRLRAYGGQDPLVEYKNEGHKMFQQLLQLIDTNITDNIAKASFEKKSEIQNLIEPAGSPRSVQSETNSKFQNSNFKNIGRNDPCPCGSGKKLKKCGILMTEEHKRNMVQKR
ncbi:MAG: SEC-C metal-binding domain-containing protein, partial [Patescibacteria group bacterium]